MSPKLACRDENGRHFALSPTCRRHVADISSQGSGPNIDVVIFLHLTQILFDCCVVDVIVAVIIVVIFGISFCITAICPLFLCRCASVWNLGVSSRRRYSIVAQLSGWLLCHVSC